MIQSDDVAWLNRGASEQTDAVLVEIDQSARVFFALAVAGYAVRIEYRECYFLRQLVWQRHAFWIIGVVHFF